jgi:glyoxylase-like metal-dependent hydrolase (beta-lactamase superfamily II)
MAGVKQEVFAVTSAYVNAFIVRGERSIIVDTGVPGYGSRILKTMSCHDIRPQDISLIIITHGHHDHTGSAAYLREKTGAPVAIHRSDVEALRTGINPPLCGVGGKGRFMVALFKMMKMPAVQGIEPQILLEKETDLADYGIEGTIMPTPGHTAGSVSVLLAGGCALVGDMIFGGLMRKHSPGFPYFCQDVETASKSIRDILDRKPKIFYAGHGGPFTGGQVWRKFFVKP